MHGQPRNYKDKLKDPKILAAHKKKVQAIKEATALVLECRRERRFDDTALNASAKLLRVVPEIYTVWNYRKEALQPIFREGGDQAREATTKELELTFICLQENPKSYASWHHRKWVVEKGFCSIEKELRTVTSALDQDERNFHAWGYRQFLIKLSGERLRDEVTYTDEKIVQNFSNYSAWHYRTVVLPKLYCEEIKTVTFDNLLAGETPTSNTKSKDGDTSTFTGTASQKAPIPLHILDQEYDTIHQAFATDDEDQSPWLYYQWLIGNTINHLSKDSAEEILETNKRKINHVIEREIRRLKEDHIASAPNAKWPLLSYVRLLESQVKFNLVEGAADKTKQEIAPLYVRLQNLDPFRTGFYEDAAKQSACLMLVAS